MADASDIQLEDYETAEVAAMLVLDDMRDNPARYQGYGADAPILYFKELLVAENESFSMSQIARLYIILLKPKLPKFYR